jgi:hypothetical protein
MLCEASQPSAAMMISGKSAPRKKRFKEASRKGYLVCLRVQSLVENLGIPSGNIGGKLRADPTTRGPEFTVRARGQSLEDTSNVIRVNFRKNGAILRYTDGAGNYIDPRTGQAIPGKAGRMSPLTHINVGKYRGPLNNLPFK